MQEIIEITTPFIRLCDFLKFAGICESGGRAKEAILDGEVFVNNEVCLLKGKKLYPNDVVKIEGQEYAVK